MISFVVPSKSLKIAVDDLLFAPRAPDQSTTRVLAKLFRILPTNEVRFFMEVPASHELCQSHKWNRRVVVVFAGNNGSHNGAPLKNETC
jgi:hypothetical protein